MEGGKINLFIVADHALVVNGLKHYLAGRFGSVLSITNFYNRKSCIRKVNNKTEVVVLDSILNSKSYSDTFRKIKTINPFTEIIMHSTNEEVAGFIEEIQKKKSILQNVPNTGNDVAPAQHNGSRIS